MRTTRRGFLKSLGFMAVGLALASSALLASENRGPLKPTGPVVPISPIVHPFNACPEIVVAGKVMTIMFKAADGESVTSVALQGPFQRIDIPAKGLRAERGSFSYDPVYDARYTLRLSVTVPADCPADLYDLIVKTNKREAVSLKSVDVIKGYRRRYTVVHVTDAHIARNWTGGDIKTGHPPVLEHLAQIINVVNIIGPDFVVHTGDGITNFNRSTELAQPGIDMKWGCFWDGKGKWRGMHGFDAPVFNAAGNHDHYEEPGCQAEQYLRYNGLRTFGMAYGTGRFLFLDDSLGKFQKDPTPQFKVLDDFLAKAGPGQLRVLLHHQPKLAPEAFLDKHKIQLDLTGHAHRNKEYNVGKTPTLLIITKNAGRILEDDPGWFRVLTIEGDKVVFNERFRYGDNTKQQALLKLTYAAGNDGSAVKNTATITNGFDAAFPTCHVRFVMKRGSYAVSGGRVEQSYNADKVTVCDVRVPVAAHGKATVSIAPK